MKAFRLQYLLPVLFFSAALAGCAANQVDSVKTEIAVRFDIAEKTRTPVKSVSCPSGVEVIVGARFTCTVTARDGVEALAEIEIMSDDADLKILRLTNP
ncbi:MAG: DUF4333 domain-containing protein [Solirubrobacterales bacterium]